MGWIHTITHPISSGINKAKEAAEAAERASVAAAEKAERIAAEKAEEAAEAAAAAKKLAEEKTEAAAEAAAKKAEEIKAEAAKAAEEAKKAAAEAANKTGNSFVHATNAASSAAVSAWSASSVEAQSLSSAVEKEGIVIGNGFISGATVVGNGIEEGAEVIGKGAVALGDYISDHACDLLLGSALSAAFAALAADGEEEASVGSIAALAVTGFVDKLALATAAKALAFIIVEPIFAIPGVSKSVGHKSDLEAIIAFLITKACTEKPKLVVGSGGQFIAGVLIYGITSVVCEGKVPGGFTIWKGAQASM